MCQFAHSTWQKIGWLLSPLALRQRCLQQIAALPTFTQSPQHNGWKSWGKKIRFLARKFKLKNVELCRCPDYLRYPDNKADHQIQNKFSIFGNLSPSGLVRSASDKWSNFQDFLPTVTIVLRATTAHCLKITQNVAFEFWHFSTNVCPMKTELTGKSIWPQDSGFQKLA